MSGFAKQSSKFLQTCFTLGTLLESCFWGVRDTVETKFRTTRGEKLSSLFLPLSLPAPPDCRCDGSLSGRFRKKRNKRRKIRTAHLPFPGCMPEFTGHLGVQMLTVDHLPPSVLLRWPRFLQRSDHFTRHSHHHSKNQWQLFPNLFSTIHPLLEWRVLRRQESEPRQFWSPRTTTGCLTRQVTQPEAQPGHSGSVFSLGTSRS